MFNSSRNERVFGMTLTEVVIMILFLFLLVSETVISSLSDENDKLNAIPSLAVLSPAERDSLANMAHISVLIQDLRDSLKSQRTQIAVMDSLIMQEPDDERLASMLEYTNKKIQEYELRAQVERSDSVDMALTILGSTLMQCQSDVQYCFDRLGDYPPCWTKGGRAEYIYDVTLLRDSLLITAVWPSNRHGEAILIPGAMNLSGVISNSAFRVHAMDVLNWSDDRSPACRHFVTINDSPTLSKEQYKDQLKVVEGYFYKYLLD